ncbi:MAG: hypothetical protein NTX87_16760 [Planctomycetota bacterium]|nr:hypothetical protein [Planctomycetota bacterium]
MAGDWGPFEVRKAPEQWFTVPERTVVPTYELGDLIRGYEQEPVPDADQKAGLAAAVAEWTNLRKAGRTRWGSEKWMKDPQYYARLDTPALAQECFSGFSGGVFANEMGIFNEPALGLESLRVFHNGFAELLSRDDMWKGILRVYDRLSSQIDPKADLPQIVRTSGELDELLKLYKLSPLKEQVKGREKLFLAAHVGVLKKYRDYLDNYDPKAMGGSPGFFREPCSVAQVALLMAKQVDPQRYAKIEPAVTSVRWTREQNVEDLKRFIALVLDSLDGIPMNQEER